jgi:hypothetical protein
LIDLRMAGDVIDLKLDRLDPYFGAARPSITTPEAR